MDPLDPDAPSICYVALIGDLVASREVSSAVRGRVQAELGQELGALNEALGPGVLAAPFVQTAGDELQALLRIAAPAVLSIQRITDRLLAAANQRVAFGVGWGELATEPLPPAPAQAENVALLDGAAFHLAREALEAARAQHSWAVFRGFGAGAEAALDGLFELMGVVRARWTTTQASYAYELRRLGLQKDVAAKFDVSPSVVSESLKAAAFDAALRGERRATRFLEELDRRREEPE